MVNEYEIKKQICDIGRRIYSRNMVAANDGNISVKLNDNEFLCTPTGVSKGFMTPEYICKVDREGNVIQANPGFKPSSEIKMHMRVYEKRPDVGSVVHAHPIYATSFAIAGIPLTQPIMPEAVISLGCVPIAEYGTPSTMEIPDNLEKYLPYFDAVLLENHGALTWSTDLNAAYMKMESVEFYAQLLYQSKVLGGPKEFDEKNIEKLYEIRRKFGMAGKHPANLCLNKDGKNCHNCGGACQDGEFKKFPGYQYDFVGGYSKPAENNAASDAQLVAENIALQLENRVSFRRAMKACMGRTMKSGAQGIKCACSGRLGGADMARTEFYSEGTIPLQTLRADIDYGFAEADTTYGKVGVKTWIYHGEVLPTKTVKKEGGNK